MPHDPHGAKTATRRVYPGVTGTYSDAAWSLAEWFTDGRITDAILASCEAQITAEAAPRADKSEGA